jgi:hypothetical protein
LNKKETKERHLYKSRREMQEIMKMVIEGGKERTRDPTKAAN